jgi:hypothetical protein
LKFIFLKSLRSCHTYRQAGNAAQVGYESEAQFLFSATLAQTFNNRYSALTGAAITVLAFAEPFIAAGAAVGFLVLFSYRKRTKPPRL